MKTRNIFLVILLGMLMLVQPATAAPKKGTFTVGDKTFLLNGQPFVVKAAEIHYPRIPRPYWEHRIKVLPAASKTTRYISTNSSILVCIQG